MPRSPGTAFTAGGRTYRYFGGTAYLGMASLPEFRQAMAQEIERWGTHWGASRNGNLRLGIYADVEAALAKWIGSPATCTLSSGFLAGRLITEAFPEAHYQRFFAPSCHAALLPAGTERFKSWELLQKALHEYMEQRDTRKAVVFSDSLDFSQGPASLLPIFKTLPAAQLILAVDDSHGIGVMGPEGRSAWPEVAGMGFKECLVSASLGKAMGVTAGMIAGTAERIRALQSQPLFSGASPAPPAAMGALLAGLEKGWYRQGLNTVRKRIRDLIDQLPGEHQLKHMDTYPVFTFQDPALAQYLFRHGIVITHFDYPAEAGGRSPSRIVLSASHSREDLDILAGLLKDYYREQ